MQSRELLLDEYYDRGVGGESIWDWLVDALLDDAHANPKQKVTSLNLTVWIGDDPNPFAGFTVSYDF